MRPTNRQLTTTTLTLKTLTTDKRGWPIGPVPVVRVLGCHEYTPTKTTLTVFAKLRHILRSANKVAGICACNPLARSSISRETLSKLCRTNGTPLWQHGAMVTGTQNGTPTRAAATKGIGGKIAAKNALVVLQLHAVAKAPVTEKPANASAAANSTHQPARVLSAWLLIVGAASLTRLRSLHNSRNRQRAALGSMQPQAAKHCLWRAFKIWAGSATRAVYRWWICGATVFALDSQKP